MLKMLPLKNKRLTEIRKSHFYMSYSLTKNATKVKKYYMLVVFLASGS